MELSILIAKIAAAVYISSGLAVLNNSLNLNKAYQILESSRLMTAYMGIFTATLGTLIVSYHNLWVKDWPVLITIIGWIFLVEAAFYILAPKAILGLFRKLPQSQIGWGLFTIAFGLVFGYFGFVA